MKPRSTTEWSQTSVLEFTKDVLAQLTLAGLAIWSLGIILPQHPIAGTLLVFTEGFRSFPLVFAIYVLFVSLVVVVHAKRTMPAFSGVVILTAVLALAVQVSRGKDFIPSFGSKQPHPGKRTLTIAAANTEFGVSDGGTLLGVLAPAAPDVLVVSEATQRWIDRSGVREHFPYHLEFPGKRAEGIAVYSKREMVDAAELSMQGMFTTVAVTLLDGTPNPPRLIAIHAPPPQVDMSLKGRSEYFRVLGEYIETLAPRTPVLVVGDFNTTPFSDAYQAFVATHHLSHAAAGTLLPTTWGAPGIGAFIDHILVRGYTADGSFKVLEPFGSDHRPVVATLSTLQEGRADADS